MAKYADITPFYEWLEELMRLDTSNHPDHNTLMFYEIMGELDSLPEMVRCKDCEHWGGKYATNECSLITQLGNPDYWLKTAPDDFCSSGKRKEK